MAPDIKSVSGLGVFITGDDTEDRGNGGEGEVANLGNRDEWLPQAPKRWAGETIPDYGHRW